MEPCGFINYFLSEKNVKISRFNPEFFMNPNLQNVKVLTNFVPMKFKIKNSTFFSSKN